LNFKVYLSIKKLLSEGCSELPAAWAAELKLLDCYEDGGKVCCPSPEEVALWAVIRGVMGEHEAASYLNWKAFESYVARALEEAGFETLKNVRVRAGDKLAEFDVIGYDGDKVIVVECKRWSAFRRSALLKVAEEHKAKVERAAYWLAKLGKRALPVVVTLRGTPIREGALIVPIKSFKGFIEEVDLAFLEGPVVTLSSSRS